MNQTAFEKVADEVMELTGIDEVSLLHFVLGYVSKAGSQPGEMDRLRQAIADEIKLLRAKRGTEQIWPIPRERQRCLLTNAHALLRKKFKGTPLWSFIGHITGHGSGYSIEICKANNWNPNQDASLPIK